MAIDTLAKQAKASAVGVINRKFRKVAGNIAGLIDSGRGQSSADSDPINRTKFHTNTYSFPIDIGDDPGLGNQGHYMMFHINEQTNAKITFHGKKGNNTKTSKSRPIPKYIKRLAANGAFVKSSTKPADYAGEQFNETVKSIESSFAGDPAQYFEGGAQELNDLAVATAKKYATERAAIAVERAPTRRLKSSVAMYMPASVTTGYSAQYTDTEIGAVTEQALKAYDQFAQGNMRGGLNEIGNMDTALAESISAMMLTTVGALPGFAGIKAAAEMRKGVVLSDRMELAFKGIDKRSFSYEFTMIPKSQAEAEEIRNIIFIFKSNMLPEFDGNGRMGRSLRVPNTFHIEYMWNGAENQFLSRISECVLTSMNVTQGGDRYKTHKGIEGDGAPPIETKMSLEFKELELITRERVHEGY